MKIAQVLVTIAGGATGRLARVARPECVDPPFFDLVQLRVYTRSDVEGGEKREDRQGARHHGHQQPSAP
jgi:hypothetical protein